MRDDNDERVAQVFVEEKNPGSDWKEYTVVTNYGNTGWASALTPEHGIQAAFRKAAGR